MSFSCCPVLLCHFKLVVLSNTCCLNGCALNAMSMHAYSNT